MKSLVLKAAAWLSDLRVAIVLLLLIAACSGLGTAIPQGSQRPSITSVTTPPPGWGW